MVQLLYGGAHDRSMPVKNGSRPEAPVGGQMTQFVVLVVVEDGAGVLGAADPLVFAEPVALLLALAVPVHEPVHAVVAAVIAVGIVVVVAGAAGASVGRAIAPPAEG
jgi:hypothetical protein